jgi:DNA-binding XRE family transcriptional regulator
MRGRPGLTSACIRHWKPTSELTEEERSLVELRVAVARAVRRLREQLHLSQQELASRIQLSQSRVAKIEAAAKGVSLDLSFRGLFAVGGKIADLAVSSTEIRSVRRSRRGVQPKRRQIS